MTPPDPNDRPGWGGPALAQGDTLLALLLSGMLVWGGIGWALDTWVLPTRPWGMVVGILLGFAAGTYLVYLRTEELGRVEEERRAAG